MFTCEKLFVIQRDTIKRHNVHIVARQRIAVKLERTALVSDLKTMSVRASKLIPPPGALMWTPCVPDMCNVLVGDSTL